MRYYFVTLLLLFLTCAGAYAASGNMLLNLYRMAENEEIAQFEFVKTNNFLQLYTKTNRMILQENLEQARSREQSLANKMLTAATMAATGLGGMQLASGLAEQKADEEAETAMRAYLATFTCEYGDKRFAGGESAIELPGANILTPLVMEYKALAADLKARKAALGMQPGVESEEIIDAATAGLYDDENVGKTGGAYTSLSRALSGDETAAAEWNAQREESAQKIKTGATVGGVGAAGGAIGNLIINGDKK